MELDELKRKVFQYAEEHYKSQIINDNKLYIHTNEDIRFSACFLPTSQLLIRAVVPMPNLRKHPSPTDLLNNINAESSSDCYSLIHAKDCDALLYTSSAPLTIYGEYSLPLALSCIDTPLRIIPYAMEVLKGKKTVTEYRKFKTNQKEFETYEKYL